MRFADHTRGHSRRWCSMALCGNARKSLRIANVRKKSRKTCCKTRYEARRAAYTVTRPRQTRTRLQKRTARLATHENALHEAPLK
ncbi:CGNR zinc finger domain-containing protein [Paraburkholderia sp. SOS3]|uniref:CGNR zinc finger domain-containing protein n=1 Tax=Paraburkholderia sp. SOS3 TaxID=1926494 RepID=UPI002FBE25CB